jgi:hypothetical protein
VGTPTACSISDWEDGINYYMCFHEGLQIIAYPLLESLALGKQSQITKLCGNGNTVLSSGLEGERKKKTGSLMINIV